MTSEVSREAPMYSDLREKHVPVKGLEPGDTLEYSVRWQIERPLATGQFWIGYQFIKGAIVLDEQLEINVPREREVRLKSQTIQPTTREENGRRIYTWKASNLDSVSVEEQKRVQSYDTVRGLLPPADVLISSFRTWQEVGRWYESLQQEKIQPSPEVKAKAEELTKGLQDDATNYAPFITMSACATAMWRLPLASDAINPMRQRKLSETNMETAKTSTHCWQHC